MIIKARYVVPVDRPAIENGAVVIERGRIAAVGSAKEFPGQPATDYGDAVICPGFVNAHTHLDLSMLVGRIAPGPDFIAWLRHLMAIITAEPATRQRVHQAVRAGVAQSLESGVTMIGDIARTPQWTREVLSASPLRGVSFGEVTAIGTRRQLLSERLDAALAEDWRSEQMKIGISPHASYSVEPAGMRACAEQARKRNAPLCIHLAETADEERFTCTCEGPFADYLRGLGVWDELIPTSGCGPVELAERTGLLGKRTVIAHANYVTDADIKRIAASGASVAYCPRIHRAFEHTSHRFRDMLAAGINVCVGTDSLASNPSLSILDELRFLRRQHADLTADRIIAMGTLHGARALGFANVAGSLTAGKMADLAVIPLDTPNAAAGWDSMFESIQPPIAVYVSGELHRKTSEEPVG